MSLPTNLTNNEVKNASGTEIEFSHYRQDGRTKVYAKTGEAPNLPHRITVSHTESGKGTALTRRSLVRVDYTVLGGPDGATPVTVSSYNVTVVPQGMLADNAAATMAVANLNSFMASLGASTTILYDGTGYGSAAAIAGTL